MTHIENRRPSISVLPNERTRLISYQPFIPNSASERRETEFPKWIELPSVKDRRLRRVWEGLLGWIGETGVDFTVDDDLLRHVGLIRSQALHRDDSEDGLSFWQWMRQDLSEDSLVVPLLMITFSCALADGITLKHFNTFATSMTGNTVLLAMSLCGAVARTPLFAAVSLAGFLGAGLLFGQLGNVFGNQKRWWMLLTLSFQIVILGVAAFLVTGIAHPALSVDGSEAWVYILLIGLQGGPQVAMAVNAGVREMPTAMMTTPYAALIADPNLFRSGRRQDVRARNRRVIYIVIFWLGAFLGAILSRWSGVWVATLVVAGLKLIVCVVILVQRGSEEEGFDYEDDNEDPIEDEISGDPIGNEMMESAVYTISEGEDLGSGVSPIRTRGSLHIREACGRDERGMEESGRMSIKSTKARRGSRRGSRDESRVPM